MNKFTKKFSVVLVALFTAFTALSYMPAKAAIVVPKVQYVEAPQLVYNAGDRVQFNLYAPNYGGRVQYRVVLWNDETKSYRDLWTTGDRYYTNWQPYGNNVFTLGWPISEPGHYRITIYTKRAGIANSKTALNGQNCDSYMESQPFVVNAKATEATVASIAPVADVTVDELATPVLPTEVTLNLADATTKVAKVVWAAVDTTKVGTFPIEGTVEGTELKATVNVIVKAVPLAVKDVTAINLIQLKVVFNKTVDQDTAETTTNYGLTDVTDGAVTVADAELQEDGKTVILTMSRAADQQDEVNLTIEDVEDASENVIDDTTVEDIEFLDMVIPTAVSASVVGVDTIKVVFSEPVVADGGSATTLDKANFKVTDADGNKLYISGVTLQNNNTEALVQLYSDLEEGKVTIEANNGTTDYALFGVIAKSFELTVAEDEVEPTVVGYKDITATGVTLVWSEDIRLIGTPALTNFYHTNDDYEVDQAVTIDGNEMTMHFATANALDPGTSYVYVKADSVEDLWENENDQEMIKVELELDETAPAVDGEVTVESQTQIVITFTEDLDETSAEKKANYTLLGSDGKEIEDMIDDITLNGDEVTIDFEDELSGEYSLVIEDVEDLAENVISDTTVDFTVDDMSRPDPTDFTAKLYNAGTDGQMVKISFGEEMATEGKYSIVDLDKYTIDGNVLADLAIEPEFTVVDGGKAIEIEIASDETTNGVDLAADVNNVTVLRVADAAGNYMTAASHTFDLVGQGTVGIESVEAIAINKVEVTLEDKLTDFDEDDIVLTTDNTDDESAIANALDIAKVVLTVNSDGNTVVTFTIAEGQELDYDLGTPVYAFVLDEDEDSHPVTIGSDNVYGEKLAATADGSAANIAEDLIAPELFDNGDTTEDADQGDYLTVNTDNTFTLTFMENMKAISNELAGNDFVVKADNETLVNGVDYEVSTIATNVITFTLLNEYAGFDGDIEIELVASPRYVTDMNDNAPAEVSVDEFEVNMLP